MNTNTKHMVIAFVGSALIVGLLAVWFNASYVAPNSFTSGNAADLSETGPLSSEELERINNEAVTANPMNPQAIFTTNQGVITLELFEDVMPVTVGNFVKLSEEGFYNETKFHRIIDGFMIQGGDPNSKSDDTSSYGRGGPGFTIQDEFVEDPRLTNTRGTIAMANTGQPNSGGSQFFVNTVDNTNLDFDKPPMTSRHPVFGRVVDGMDIVDQISVTPTAPGDIPLEPVVIESITIQRSE